MKRLALAIAALLLVGCAPTPATSPTPSTDLVAARRAAGIADCPRPTPSGPVAGGLPQLSLACLGGDTAVDLAALRGPTVINFWAQWCLPCRQEATYLAEFAADEEAPASMLGVNYDDPQPAWAIEFAQLVGWTYPQLQDPAKVTSGPVGVPGIPLSLLLDADGKVVARHAGAFASTAELRGWVRKGLS
ncbi:MAG: TlpA disulfide reductase family protein [Propionicimonas sp.]